MTDAKPPQLPDEPRLIAVTCAVCGGTGIAGYVTSDMATDACEPEMEGMPMPCSCDGGSVWVEDDCDGH